MIDLHLERSISFSDQNLAELLFSICESDEDPLDLMFDDFREKVVKRFLERALEVERDIHLGFESYTRGIPKEDSRNGYYERDIELAIGLIENLRIPRTRKNSYKSKLIANYKRRQKSVEDLMREMFIRGISTRQVGQILTPLLGIDPSAATVSRVAKALDEDVKKFRSQHIGDDYIYLMLDGVSMKVKAAAGAERKLVLCIYGIRSNGTRRLLYFRQEKSESQGAWERALNNVYGRGLIGENLKMLVTDGNPGMISALEMVYPDVPRQRCWAHKLRNVSNYCKKVNEKKCIAEARLIYKSETRKNALEHFKNWSEHWKSIEPQAVECLTRDIEDMLTVFTLPEEHRKMMRTTNLIERLFREVRRRTRPMSSFTNGPSCDRIIYAIFARFNERWETRPLSAFTQKG